MSDQDIRKLPMMGTFKFELTMSDNSTVTQRVPFFGRPRTHNEILKTKVAGSLPSFTTAFIESLVPDKWSNNLFVLPVKSKEEDTVPVPFKATWDGLAQFIYMSGVTSNSTYEVADPARYKRFETRTDLAPPKDPKPFRVSSILVMTPAIIIPKSLNLVKQIQKFIPFSNTWK